MSTKKYPNLSNYKTIAEVIADKIRQKIIDGELTPNERLSQERLSREFGVSRMPVRDALYSLEKEGLVTVSRRYGAKVCKLKLEDLQEIYSIRVPLEEMATREGVKRLTKKELKALTEAEEKAAEAIDIHDIDKFLLYDRQFHFIVYEASKMLRLIEFVSNLWNATEHYRRMYCTKIGRLAVAKENHSQYLKACRKRDVERAAELTREHILETMNEISKVLQD
ncbi:MAG: GntR family transcriptional regulator [Dethiobacteria bacterium]|jgi:DNA-binding GntR family transcriptional regulator|nr:GntR family transcriptional regulator [Bacillota bacterium]